MTHLSAICILVVISVLVQNASGKRGCAAFGHACYGGHGKRSSSLPENLLLGNSGSGGFSSGQLDRIPPLPYAKLALINRSKTFDVITPELTANELATDNGEPLVYPGPSRSERQEKFERGVRYAVNAILRQLLEESQAGSVQRQPSSSSVDLNFQPSEAGQQLQQEQQLMDNEKK